MASRFPLLSQSRSLSTIHVPPPRALTVGYFLSPPARLTVHSSPPTLADERRSAVSPAHAEELRSGPRCCRSAPPAARFATSTRVAARHVLHDLLLLRNTNTNCYRGRLADASRLEGV